MTASQSSYLNAQAKSFRYFSRVFVWFKDT